MQVRLHPRKEHQNGRRVTYDIYWHIWALPLGVALTRSWTPNELSTMDPNTWDRQVALRVRVLCMEMNIVLLGHLFPPSDDEPEISATPEDKS